MKKHFSSSCQGKTKLNKTKTINEIKNCKTCIDIFKEKRNEKKNNNKNGKKND